MHLKVGLLLAIACLVAFGCSKRESTFSAAPAAEAQDQSVKLDGQNASSSSEEYATATLAATNPGSMRSATSPRPGTDAAIAAETRTWDQEQQVNSMPPMPSTQPRPTPQDAAMPETPPPQQ